MNYHIGFLLMRNSDFPRSPICTRARQVVILVLYIGFILGGCAGDIPLIKERHANEVNAPDSEVEPLVYYTGEDGLSLYESPSFSARSIATLDRHQKVYRYKIEKGFAMVKIHGTDMSGWVNNSKLIWRLPEPDEPDSVQKPSGLSSTPTDKVIDTIPEEGKSKPGDAPAPGSEGLDPSRFDAF